VLLLASACGGGAPAARPTLDLPAAGPPAGVAPAAPPAPEPAGPKPDPWAGRADLIAPPPPAPPVPIALPPAERFSLANGLKVIVLPRHDLPVAAMHLALPAGTGDEDVAHRGVADVTAALLARGTQRHSADELAGTMDFIGGTLAAQADLDSTHVVCQTLARDFATCLSLMPEVVTMPAFAEDEVRGAQRQLIDGLRQQGGDLSAVAAAHAMNVLWGDASVRGWGRSPDAVAALTRKDVVAWHKARFVPTGAVLAVAGDVDPTRVRAELERAFAGWKGYTRDLRSPRRAKLVEPPPPAAPARAAEPHPKGLTIRLLDRPDATRAELVIAGLGVAHRDSDYLATLLDWHILGGGDASRLATALRVDRGPGYAVHAVTPSTPSSSARAGVA
jgi:zinc protease